MFPLCIFALSELIVLTSDYTSSLSDRGRREPPGRKRRSSAMAAREKLRFYNASEVDALVHRNRFSLRQSRHAQCS